MISVKKIIYIIFLFDILLLNNGFSQEVPHSVSNTGIYNFLDELANIHVIEINSVVKPYSRLYISKKLQEAEGKREKLNMRQMKELEFYMMDFGKELNDAGRTTRDARLKTSETETKGLSEVETKGTVGVYWINGGKVLRSDGTTLQLRKDLFYYQDSLFQLTVNPILGGEVFNNSSGNATYWRNGIEARGYIKNWGFYASLRDNHENPLLGRPEYLTIRQGGHIKGATDWSEMQGGVTYSWKWGNAGLVKDALQWGNNYNGANIFGGRNPTFVQLKLNISPVKWFNFSYFHGWLNSMVVDSTDSYWVTNSYGTDYREVYHKKFIAANMFTFTPFKRLNISAGNNIVYNDDAANPAYLIPIFFYKSVDHSLTSGIDNMNSQMFFDISSRQIRNLHLYAILFIDELSVSRLANDDEWYFAIDYRPIRTLGINLFFSDAIRGPDYTELGTNRIGNSPLSSVEWHNTSYGLKASYQVLNDLYTWFSFINSDISGDVRWSPEYYYGRKNTINFGMSFGF